MVSGSFITRVPMPRFLLPLTLLTAAAFGQSKPNIIFFFADDLGYGDIGCFWQDQRASSKKFDTPALDTMAAQGAKLTHHYVSASVCAPSRASLIQGRHQGHSDVRNSQFDKALPNNHNIASVLKAAVYRTIHIGKDGLAGAETLTSLTGTGSQNLPGHPLKRGFDRFFGNQFTFTHALNASPASDLTPRYQWSADLVNFHQDGLTNGAGTTTVSFTRGASSGGLVSVMATVTGSLIPDRIFARVEVTQN